MIAGYLARDSNQKKRTEKILQNGYHFGNFCLILQRERLEGDSQAGFEGFLVETSCSRATIEILAQGNGGNGLEFVCSYKKQISLSKYFRQPKGGFQYQRESLQDSGKD